MTTRKDGVLNAGQTLERGAVLAILRATPMTTDQLAAHAGCTRNSAQLMISRLQRLGLISVCGRQNGPAGKYWRFVFSTT